MAFVQLRRLGSPGSWLMNSFVQCSLLGVSMASFISGLFDVFQPRMPVWGQTL